MTAFRYFIGPNPGPFHSLYQAVELDEDGKDFVGYGQTLREAIKALDVDSDSGGKWVTTPLFMKVAKRRGKKRLGEPSETQRHAMHRLVLRAVDPAADYTQTDPQALATLMTGLAMRAKLGPTNPVGTYSRFKCELEGSIRESWYVLLNANETDMTVLALRSKQHMDALLSESPPTMYAATILALDGWRANLVAQLTGVPFVPQLVTCKDNTLVPVSTEIAELLSLMAISWPDGAANAESAYALSEGRKGTMSWTLLEGE